MADKEVGSIFWKDTGCARLGFARRVYDDVPVIPWLALPAIDAALEHWAIDRALAAEGVELMGHNPPEPIPRSPARERRSLSCRPVA